MGAKTEKLTTTEAREAPGPSGHRILGSLPDFQKDPIAFFMRARREFGDVVRFWMGPKAVYLVTHPDGVKHVMQDNHKNYGKNTRGWQVLRTFLGQGLLTSEGDYWLRHRRTMQPAFHRQRIAAFGETMVADTQALVDRWLASEGRPIDVAEEMMALTLEIVGETMLSTRIAHGADAVGQALPVVLRHANRNITGIFNLPPKIPTPNNRRFNAAVKILDDLVLGVIEGRRKGGDDPGDLLSMLMAMRDEETGEAMNDIQLRDEIMTIFLAGHETTANLLTWTWYLLSTHPAVARTLRAELAQELGGQAPTMADLGRLPYLTAVLHEAMRLYPPAWMMARDAIDDDVVRGFKIPAGAFVLTSQYVTHRHPDFWENPEGFDPERFLGEHPERHKYAYFPFGVGPRQCIGNNFALMEAQLIVATIAQRVELELVPGHPVAPEPLITLRPKHGMQMAVKPRA